MPLPVSKMKASLDEVMDRLEDVIKGGDWNHPRHKVYICAVIAEYSGGYRDLLQKYEEERNVNARMREVFGQLLEELDDRLRDRSQT